jgi:hypothetical protein
MAHAAHLRPPGAGLSRVSTDALTTLTRALYKGDLTCPLTVQDLARVGLQFAAEELLGHLRGLDADGVRACVVATVAERRAAERRLADRGLDPALVRG